MVNQKTKQKLQLLEKQAVKGNDSGGRVRKASRSSNYKIPKVLIIAGVLLVILVISWITGSISWGLKYAQCGSAPVVISASFEGAGDRLYPGDKDYSPGFFNHYECMTPQEKSGTRY